MAKTKKGRPLDRWQTPHQRVRGAQLRIIGGRFKGRLIEYSGDVRTRPMKDNIREAIFNLIGGWIPGKHVLDLFSGTGAVGLEAISRGAIHATLIERHVPTVRTIRANIANLEVQDHTTVITSDTFFWFRRCLKDPAALPADPWAVFCSPPYDFYVERGVEMMELIDGLLSTSPADSLFVVESDLRFNVRDLPNSVQWKTRTYSPAQICVLRK